ncbi:MAG: Gfo/Idh/MocA family oxidoreductase, partial [Phycisphaerae bacterium]|nr:Gfo/Idh/MocA family oxidoreductase [Phycisphaerae bacterium]MDW8262356.1 Gfo/Idh/MocA family oxidoreductase [Phycisphaerales bacterium]
MADRIQPGKILRVLHVGVGNRGRWLLQKCAEQTGLQPTLLCDVSRENLNTAAALAGLGPEACFEDLDAALARAKGSIDCVIACTPTITHVAIAERAIEAGLPILIEKGMAPDWSSARKLARLVADRSAKVCVAQNYRYNPVEQTIRAAIAQPNHPAHPGQPHLVVYNQNRVRPFPRTLNYPFASVWDMSCHHFDTMMHWLG